MERSSDPMNLADAFVGLAHRWPERPALISPGLTLTYPGLAARAAQTARELRLRGVRPGAISASASATMPKPWLP